MVNTPFRKPLLAALVLLIVAGVAYLNRLSLFAWAGTRGQRFKPDLNVSCRGCA